MVKQVNHYNNETDRAHIAREFVRGAAHSLLRNLSYYERRKTDKPLTNDDPKGEIGGDLTGDVPEDIAPSGIPTDETVEAAIDNALAAPLLSDDDTLGPLSADPYHTDLPDVPFVDYDTGEGIDFLPGDPTVPQDDPLILPPLPPLFHLKATIENLSQMTAARTPANDYAVSDINTLRGFEGKMRVTYYQAWNHILADGWTFDRRVKRPPSNEINALISFGNSHLYTVCLSEIYRTQLTPTISYLHEPGARRYSLSLDLSEIFKPLIVDRAIFRLINTGQIKKSHFDKTLNGCYLNDAGRKLFIAALEERLGATIHHRRLNRSVSYRHLIRLECYKLIRHLSGLDTYRAFRAWW